MTKPENPFAFLLKKRRTSLDAAFYKSAQSFEDINDDMWLYLLDLVPKARGSYTARVNRLLAKLSPELGRYFLVRWFDGEWESEGMEGLCTSPDWLELHAPLVAAYTQIGAVRHAAIVECLVPLIDATQRAENEAEQYALLPKFKNLDRKWNGISKIENLGKLIFGAVRKDFTPYLHPTSRPSKPTPSIGLRSGLGRSATRTGRHLVN